MYIKNLKLKNYRNYSFLNLDLENGINIIYGDNAQGKTNIIEALYMSSTTKSYKQAKDKEVIKFGEEEAHIKYTYIKNEKENIIDIHLKSNKNKGIAVNGKKINKISDFFGLTNTIVFAPENLYIIKEGPYLRRKFLDYYISQIDKIYISDLSNYNKILNQRNILLKQINFNNNKKNELEIWDKQLVLYGCKIIKKRKEIIKELKNEIFEKHLFISSNTEKLFTEYEYNIDEISFEKELKNNQEKDIRFQSTQIGPHRDDIKFIINDVDIRKYGSQGQQRTAALSLKLAELSSIKKIKNDNPVLLLDDVFSELDMIRQKLLVDYIKDIQVVITVTGLTKELIEKLKPQTLYHIKNAQIIA